MFFVIITLSDDFFDNCITQVGNYHVVQVV